MTKKLPSLSAVGAVCALSMVLLLIFQFLPFWNTGTDAVSISQYIWFPSDHTDVTALISPFAQAQHPINDFVTPCVLVLLLSAVAAVTYLFSRRNILVPACTLGGSLAGIWCCLKATFRLGNLWVPILILSLIGAAASVFAFFIYIQERREATE